MITFSLNAPNTSFISQSNFKCIEPKGDISALKSLVLSQYAQYPKVITRSKLKKVNIVSKLKVKNNPESITYHDHALIADPLQNWMYVNIDYLEKREYLTQCINHEIIHLYDYNFHGSFKPSLAKWHKCNPKDFKYERGGYLGYASSFQNDFHPSDGFITTYATLGIDEDRAELFMYYYSNHLKKLLEQCIEKDTLLKAKLNLLLQEIDT